MGFECHNTGRASVRECKNLDDWQSRLDLHFRELHSNRSATAGDKPIFGLEHGLNDTEIEKLEIEVRAHIVSHPPLDRHALPWIVYASELGYKYEGDEYWPPFEECTPGWTLWGNRNWLRDCFQKFHSRHGGAKPSGKWANHFTIICWPITHAILPRDLQVQLAQILYELRHYFTAELFNNPFSLGELIAARSHGTTKRFQNLVEEPLLVGQISTALLLKGKHANGSLILNSTLARIGNDLDRERRGRDWLRGAQRYAHKGAMFKGLSSIRSPVGLTNAISTEEARREVAALAIEPRLILRPISQLSWQVLLEIPDYSHLLVTFPFLRNTLLNSRCVVSGSSGRPLARGLLLMGRQKVVLHNWPVADGVLLHFQDDHSEALDFLLRTECLLRPGPIWLFRIGSDGFAEEVRGLEVRPNQKYILLCKNDRLPLEEWSNDVEIACAGIYGVKLDVPAVLDESSITYLKRLGLASTKRIFVFPAGLASANWDGEGRAEWLSSDEPCIGIRADYPVDLISLSLDGFENEKLEISQIIPGSVVYFALPSLPVGTYRLLVSSQPSLLTTSSPSGQLELVIREPHHWKTGECTSGLLSVLVDPPTPTLEEIWESRATIEIDGPTQHQVLFTISLFERGSNNPCIKRTLPALRFPVNPHTWHAHFEKYFRWVPEVEKMYDVAYSCRIEICAEELGMFSLVCEREFTPLRWAIRGDGSSYFIRLINDTGSAISPSVEHFEYGRPDDPLVLESADFLRGFKASDSGGMYLALVGFTKQALIVPPISTDIHLLKKMVKLKRRKRTAEDIANIISIVELWASARRTGAFFSDIQHYYILEALHSQIIELIAGQNWLKAERAFPNNSGDEAVDRLKSFVFSSPQQAGFAAALAIQYREYASTASTERTSCFIELATKFRVIPSPAVILKESTALHLITPQWICEFALRLASAPETAKVWAGEKLPAGTVLLLESPILLKGARFLVKSIDRIKPCNGIAGRLHPNWEWE